MGKEKSNSGMTIEQLTDDFPDIVAQIEKNGAEKLAAEIAAAPIDKVAEKFPAIVKAITQKVSDAARIMPANLKIPGFLLEIKDPFASSVASEYARVAGCEVGQLPMILPFETKEATIAALRSYYMRANGAGDKDRANAAVETLKKLGVDVTKKMQR